MKITLNCKPSKVSLIQMYLPTSDYSDEEVLAMYIKIETIMITFLCKDILKLTSDINVKVCRTSNDIRNVLGEYGLEERNVKGNN